MKSGHTFTGFGAVVLMVLISFAPAVKGDGGYIPASPADVYESGQNAIIGWDGEVERLYLSVNIYAEEDTNGFHIIPFPSMPEISLGSLSIFENCSLYLEDFITYHSYSARDGENAGGDERDVEVMLQETIGEHDVTVIRVNDVTDFKDELMEIIDDIGMDINSWPDGLNRIITNYTAKGYNYFSIDNYPIYKREKTVDPLVYEFETDVLFFPLEISSMLEGDSIIRLAMFTDPKIPLDLSILDDVLSYPHRSYQFVSSEILSYIDEGLCDMFPDGAIHHYFSFNLPLSRVRGDVIIPRDDMISWADTFHVNLARNYEVNIDHIPELGLIVYEKRNIESLGICCRNFEDGELAWEWVIPCEPHDPPHYFGMFIEDIDQDGSKDILVYSKGSYYDDDFSFTRLDPLTGGEIEMELPELDFIPEKGQVFMDLNGSKYFGFLSEYKMIVIDPETMNCIATLEMPEPDNWGVGPNIPLDDYLMHTWDGIGEGISFHDGRRHCAWSPFHQLTEEERNSSGFIDANIIWQQNFRFKFEFEHDGMTYWFGTRWVSTPATYLHIFDPDTGDLLDDVSYEEFPELKDCLEYLVFDFDENGEDDLIAVYNDRSRDDGSFHIACLDPISGRRYWDTELILGEYWFKELKVADLGGDGSSVFIITSTDSVSVVDSADGTIIWSESDSFLREGYPDLDGDGRKEIIISHHPCYMKVVDPFTGSETLNISYLRVGDIPIISIDLNQDGFEDLIYIKQYPWDSHLPSEIMILDGKTGDEMRYIDLPWPSFIFEGDGSTLLVVETQSRGMGINFNAEMMDRLQNNETARYSITILEEGPSEEDEGIDIFEVAPLFLLACLLMVPMYLMVVKRKRR